MGDFLSPQRRDLKDRLRRRIEEYRQHTHGCLSRFQPRINDRYEQYRQDTQLLHQRWLESKEKKAGKQPKTNKESNPLSEQRNIVLSQKLKRKLEASEGSSADCGPFTFNDDPVERPPLKKRAGGVDLSVQIVQQINSQPELSQTIETNVTVSSTLKPLHDGGSSNSPHPGGQQGLTSFRTSTSVECKQEPSDDSNCLEPQGSHSGYNSEFDDDLQALLETLEKEGGLSEDLLSDIATKLDDVCCKVSSETKDSGPSDSMSVLSPGPPKGTSPAVQPAQSGTSTPMSQMYDVNQNMDSLQSTVPMGQYRPSSNQSQIGGIAETGPAAETLKQMAAHHQNQQPPPAYGPMKSSPMSPYSDPLHEDRYLQQRNGFPNYQQQGFPSLPQQSSQNPSMYPYNQQVPMGQAKDPHLTYGRTKPLTHFPDPMGGQANSGQPPSSLQQLQNQVKAQFSSATTPQMQISQSQQMQITQGPHRMQMSQSQQMQMQQPPRQFSMSQQQSFNMGSNMGPNQAQFVNDPVKMQMYQEKMRQEQQQQILEHQRRAQMQQFMNRPPPEYKMQGSVNTSPGFTVNGAMGPSPLQTMQNMVNQTSTIPGGYSQVKSEVGSINPASVGSQVGPLGSGAPVVGSQGIHPDMVTNSTQMDSFASQQMQQRQQMYKQSQMAAAGQLPSTANLTRAPRPAAPTYSSSIMRNQRPPNVNVGPDGLNISQPRNPVEWQRPMLNTSGQRHPVSHQGQLNRAPGPGNMMPYAPYTNSATGMQMQQQRTGQITAMQGQSVVMQSNAQAIMQQRMQMSQQMVLRQNMASSQTGSSPYPVNPAVSMATQGQAPPHGQTSHSQNYSTSVPTSQSEFPLDFLDGAQSANSDFFDTMVQSTNSSDFAILDEILGK